MSYSSQSLMTSSAITQTVNIKIGSGAYIASALFQEFRASGKCLKRRRENHLRDTTRQHHLSWLLASHPLQVRAGCNQLIPLFVTMSYYFRIYRSFVP